MDFQLFEARNRLGGRILTMNAAGQPDAGGFDLSPSWFWPAMQPAIAALVAELSLPSFGQSSKGDVVFERMSREPAQRYPGLRQKPQSMRLVGGSAGLIRALTGRLPADRLHNGTQVTALTLDTGGVTLSLLGSNGREESLHAAQVIAALSPHLLEHSIRFTPDVPPYIRSLWQRTPTWMAPHAKFFALYDRPFWLEAGFSGTAQSIFTHHLGSHRAPDP